MSHLGFSELEPVLEEIEKKEPKIQLTDDQMIANARNKLMDQSKESVIEHYCSLVKVLFAIVNARDEMNITENLS